LGEGIVNRKIILKSRPEKEPAENNFEIQEENLVNLEVGLVRLKTIYLSLDPYMRGRMNAGRSYSQPVELGAVMEGEAVSQVVESDSGKFSKGDIVIGRTGWQTMPVVHEEKIEKVELNGAPLSLALGTLGMPGRTAYIGMTNIAFPKEGETLVVSAASGAVGSVVGQIGKIYNCKVIGVVGNEDKKRYVKEHLGFDECLNYNTQNFSEELKSTCKNGVDIYWENVGGKTFDAVYPLFNDFARIPVCGMISMYNNEFDKEAEDRLPMLFRNTLTWRLRIQGFIVSEFPEQKQEAMNKLTSWFKDGKLKYKEDVVEGLENVVEAFRGLLKGKNFGKLIIKLADEPN
jgi:NADPH-dependent curcumin reductase CurA